MNFNPCNFNFDKRIINENETLVSWLFPMVWAQASELFFNPKGDSPVILLKNHCCIFTAATLFQAICLPACSFNLLPTLLLKRPCYSSCGRQTKNISIGCAASQTSPLTHSAISQDPQGGLTHIKVCEALTFASPRHGEA